MQTRSHGQDLGTAAAEAFADPTFKDRAYAVYADLRAADPVSSARMPDGRTMWFVARYDDTLTVLRDHARFGNDPGNVFSQDQLEAMYAGWLSRLTPEQQARVAEVDRAISRHLLGVDPPNHSRLRRLVSQSFTPRFVEGLRLRVQQIADGLVDEIEARAAASGERRFDLIEAFAFPLPLTVIAEMLGIPVGMRERFRVWSHAAVAFNPAEPGDPGQNDLLFEFVEYLRGLIAKKREAPADDLVSGLVEAESEGDRLSEDELVAMIFLLIVAGHETTVNLIGNGMLTLFEHPEQLARLKVEPSPDLMKGAIEEILRYSGPVEHSLSRWAREDIELHGQTIRRGEQVIVLLASADRDETLVADPERFDIGREPVRHLAFGMGIHVCLGAPLARIEGQVAFSTLLGRMPGLRLDAPREALRWRRGSLIRGVETLPVAF